MFRSCQCVLNSLPFVPMALSTLDTLEQRMEAAQLGSTAPTKTHAHPVRQPPQFVIGGSEKIDQLHWFSSKSQLPFFTSPKHDGVRLISYVPPALPEASTAAKTRQAKKKTGRQSAVSDDLAHPGMTCYSRYGRPIYGLFWIEEELRLLRALCGDASLIVDGELYLHQTHMDPASTHTPAVTNLSAGTNTAVGDRKQGRTRKVPLSAAHAAALSPGEGGAVKRSASSSPSAETFKTGFLAVSALVHRLRGSTSQCATEAEVLQYVPALPHVCVFDVPSYSPSPDSLCDISLSTPAAWSRSVVASLPRSVSAKAQRAVAAELRRVREEVLHDLRIRDVEQLRVVPNLTPFSQRLRTMSFLFQLLEKGVASPTLREVYCSSQQRAPERHATPPTTEGCGTPRKRGASSARPSSKAATEAKDLFVYHGGTFVRRIPYHLATSLADTTQRILPAYLQHGYEGAVMRSPANVYDFKEKRKGTLAALVAPLLRAGGGTTAGSSSSSKGVALSSRRSSGRRDSLRSRRDRAALLLSLSRPPTTAPPTWMVRAYPHHAPSMEPLAPVESAQASPVTVGHDAVATGERALQRARQLPTRSETAVKVLAYQDREYAILRPLLKEPSRNPNTRVLVSIPRSSVSSLGYPIKPDTDTADGTAEEEKAGSRGRSGKAASSASASAAPTNSVVVFYGLQCLAENGLVFNVSMPKLTLAQQKALLEHLLAAGRRSASAAGGAKGAGAAAVRRGKNKSGSQKMASMTGLYATVKFSTLTEHGLPRFGTVKAIRGGKGWFM